MPTQGREMRAPNFIQLARLDEQHFISGCRHGLVHVTWGRSTLRFSREEFRRLAGLLGRVVNALPPMDARDGEIWVTRRLDEDCELRIGSLILLLPPAEFRAFVQASAEAVRRLDEILASGIWDRRDEEEEGPPDILQQLRRVSFSRN
jgi:hypothetical protein